MEIRKPDSEELKEISSLRRASMLEATLGDADLSSEEIKQLMNPLLERGCYYLAGIEKEQLVGWIMVGSQADYFTKQKAGFIYELYIKKEYRKKGYARQLMNHVLNRFKQEGYHEVRLNVYEGNGAKRLYESLGFTPKNTIMNKGL